MSPRALLVADPVTKLQPRFDTTLRFAHEMLKRGYGTVDYCDVLATDLGATNYLEALPVQKILSVAPHEATFLSLGPVEKKNVAQSYDVVFQRKDPPVDDTFRKIMRLFGRLPAQVLQINNPLKAMAFSEHELPLRYPEYAVPTIRCDSFSEFVRAVRHQPGEAVAKPFNECSGNGIVFFSPSASEKDLAAYWTRFQPSVIIQPYLEEITRSGDLRVIVMNQRILGQVLRVPKQGSRLANLHQGASARAWPLSERHREACRVVSADLATQGLHLLGLDFIGDLLSEVNITSPSSLVQINEVMGIESHAMVIDEVEKMVGKR